MSERILSLREAVDILLAAHTNAANHEEPLKVHPVHPMDADSMFYMEAWRTLRRYARNPS